MKKILENCQKNEFKKKIKKLIREVYNDDSYLQIILQLCKLHIKCLFNLAKNRNSDVTKNFMQLGVVQFLTKEIDLEHEASEKIYKFKTQKLKDEEAENTKSNNQNENKNSISNNNEGNNFSNKLVQDKKNIRKEDDCVNNPKVSNNNIENETFELNKDFGSFKLKKDYKSRSSNKNITNRDNDVNEKDVANNNEIHDFNEESEDLSNYSDLSVDLIDPEKIQNTNIKINKNLNLTNLINAYSISNNQVSRPKIDIFSEKKIKVNDNVVKVAEKEPSEQIERSENVNLEKNLKLNSQIETQEDGKWSFKNIDFNKKSHGESQPSLYNLNSISSMNKNQVKANKKILNFDLKNPNKKETQNNINTEKSAWLFNSSYVETDKIKIENIQSNADLEKEDNKDCSEKSKSKGSLISGSSFDDLDSLNFGTFRSKSSNRLMDIVANPDFVKSKIPIKIAKCKFLNFFL